MKTDRLIQRLRESLCLSTEECSDKSILDVTEGTFVRAVIELQLAFEDFRSVTFEKLPRLFSKFFPAKKPSELSIQPYQQALNLCAAAGLSPLRVNLDGGCPQTINDILENLGNRLPPIPDDIAKELAVTTIYSLDQIRKSFL